MPSDMVVQWDWKSIAVPGSLPKVNDTVENEAVNRAKEKRQATYMM